MESPEGYLVNNIDLLRKKGKHHLRHILQGTTMCSEYGKLLHRKLLISHYSCFRLNKTYILDNIPILSYQQYLQPT